MNESGETSPPLADALRVAAAAWLGLRTGNSLDRALQAANAASTCAPHPRLAAAARDIAYTATRNLALIDAMLARLARRTPDAPVASLLSVALGQLLAERHPAYAVVDQAVAAAGAEAATRAAGGFVNAVLRSALRAMPSLRAELERQPTVALNAPRWWIDRLRESEPKRFVEVLQLQRQPPPLVLRVNRRRSSVDAYVARVHEEGLAASRVGIDAVWLHSPLPVQAIPGFAAGEVSVQDAGSQLAARFLDLRDGMRVLDACAAPGGKTAQLAELADAFEIDAVEIDAQRAARIEENLARLNARSHARITVKVVDAAKLDATDRGYSRILLDAPCTASGIVRRHPDIPWLRRSADVAQLATAQARLLDALWPLVVPAGRLLYVVCSVFAEEGAQQAARFLRQHADARAAPLPGVGQPQLALLPAQAEAPWSDGLPSVHDGFFFALFEKK